MNKRQSWGCYKLYIHVTKGYKIRNTLSQCLTFLTGVNFKIILRLVSEKMLSEVIEIILNSTPVRRMNGIRHFITRITCINCVFIRAGQIIPHQRALNSVQYMWILYTVPEKNGFLQLMNLMRCSRWGEIRAFVWIDGWMWGIRHTGTTSQGIAVLSMKINNETYQHRKSAGELHKW